MNDNVHLILGADYGDYDNDSTNLRASLGLGYNFLLVGGEASASLAVKVLHQREEVGPADDDDTGYALSLDVRHFYQGDITGFGLEGEIEGYWELNRQDVMDEAELTSIIGGRYHFSDGFAVNLEVQVLDDSIRAPSSFPGLSIGTYFKY